MTTQEQIYLFIVEYTRENLYPPTVREICKAVKLKSASTVHSHLQNLEKKGLLELGGTSRAIKLIGFSLEKKG